MKEYDVNVDDVTNDELLVLTSQNSPKSHSELDKLFAEAAKSGKDSILRDKWKQDVEERKAFQKDQKRNGMTLHK